MTSEIRLGVEKKKEEKITEVIYKPFSIAMPGRITFTNNFNGPCEGQGHGLKFCVTRQKCAL